MPSVSETADGIDIVTDEWRSRLLAVDATAAQRKPSEDRWSISEVVGHLVDSASNNHQRFVRAQFCDELSFPKYEQNEWVAVANYVDCDWESLVNLWYYYNRQLATLVRNIPSSALLTPCTITPYETCTLDFLVTDYLTHLHHHFAILAERIEKAEQTSDPSEL